ncbi:MAG: RluA family pseudouridine synthase [Patescibacteria group bacterium]
MHNNIKIIYEDNDMLAVDKPAGIVVFPEIIGVSDTPPLTLIEVLLQKYPELKNAGEAPRYGIVHRLDKDTSGILLVAKTTETLKFLQKQFINREVEKKYIALATGLFKEDFGKIETLIGRSPADSRKQKCYELGGLASQRLREAITEYKVLERLTEYTLLEVSIKTGRKHQIRCHLAHIHHPIAGDKLYGFKDSPMPEGLKRQFLHASYLKIQLPNGKTEEFRSELPEDLKKVLDIIRISSELNPNATN